MTFRSIPPLAELLLTARFLQVPFYCHLMTGEINLDENDHWPLPDVDYTPYDDLISAVWPKLRYERYEWALIYDTGEYGNLDTGLQSPGMHPGVQAWGYTFKNYINIEPFEALSPRRLYRVCIHAEETVVDREGWQDTLPEFSECSDGIILDNSAPLPGDVWIGYGAQSNYQVGLGRFPM